MRYRPVILLVLAASVVGLVFAAVSTYDSMLHLDRQIHGIHCSYFLGMGRPDGAQESGCYATMMSSYSSILRQSIWGGIPVALPGMSVFAFLSFFAAWIFLFRQTGNPKTTGFLTAAASVPLLTSLIMGYLSIVTLDTVCKTCMGIYLSSFIVFGGSLFLFLKARKGPPEREAKKERKAPVEAADRLSGTAVIGFIAIGGLFVLLPVAAYAAVAPDFSRYVGNCGELETVDDPEGVMVPLGPQNRQMELIEVMDPLCKACGLFERRFRAMPEADRLRRKLLLFPLDNACNWMVDEALHPGACAVSEAIICAKEQSEEVLDFVIDHQDRIIEATKADPTAAEKIMTGRFPWLSGCIGSSKAQAKLNLALRFTVKNQLQVLTPQIYVSGLRLCDEDTDLGLEYALSRLIDRAGAMPERPHQRHAAKLPTPRSSPKKSDERPRHQKTAPPADASAVAPADAPTPASPSASGAIPAEEHAASDTAPAPSAAPASDVEAPKSPVEKKPVKAIPAPSPSPPDPAPLPEDEKSPIAPLPDKVAPPLKQPENPSPQGSPSAEVAP